MKLSVNQKELSQALHFVSGAVDGKSPLPILNSVLLKAENNKLTITATDLKIEKTIKIDADIELEGCTVVTQKKFFEVAKNIDSEKPVKLNLVDGKVKLSSGRSRFTLQTLSADDYPEFAKVGDVESIKLSASDLIDAMKRCVPMMAKADHRACLNGMLLDIDSSSVTIVTTDGHRMGRYVMPCSCSFEKKVIIPYGAVSDIMKMIAKSDDAFIDIGENSILVTVGDMKMQSKLIDGNYPDYSRVIPEQLPNKIEMSKDEFYTAVTRALTLANEKFNCVILSFEDGELTASANNPQNENAEEVIKASYFDKPFRTWVNGKYLLDAIKNIGEETIIFKCKDEMSTMRIDDDKFTAVVVPMKV